jgi:1-acyl-sn-glycerol-3-phosphate acyltransferase
VAYYTLATIQVNKLTKGIRFARLLLHIVSGLLKSLIYPQLSTAMQNRMACQWAQKFLRILNIKLHFSGTMPAVNQSPGGIFVANHTSWLDILVILAVFPVRFVAKAEIRTWPLVGRLCRNAGTLFIEREKRSDTLRINQVVSGMLLAGRSVVVFPEGMTSNGEALQHFHASLLQPTVIVQTFLYPVAIRYRKHDGTRNTSVTYVNVSILQSLMQILSEPEIEAELIFTEPISGIGRNRRELARLAEQSIAQALSLEIRHMAPGIPSGLPAAQQ